MTRKLTLAIVLAAAAVLGGCTTQTFNVAYVQAVQELVLAYPKFDPKATGSPYGQAKDHPAWDNFYETLNVRHVIVVPGSECRVEIDNIGKNWTRKTFLTVKRVAGRQVKVNTFSEVKGKGLAWPQRDVNWELARLNDFAVRLKLLESPP